MVEVQTYWKEDEQRRESDTGEQSADRLVNRKVFVVHGRNEATRESVARLLEKFDLHPVILHEQPNKGRTIIEKFEQYADVAYAVVLLTADDLGGLRPRTSEELPSLSLRARQNVLFELGFFIGKLGRHCVSALYEEGVEIPSDYPVLFTPLDKVGAWRMLLGRELQAAGLLVDLNKAV
ncbi:MAG: nucleotide-binding protein [Chlorobiaceae bacterium]|nr:nucleotide-binding protein [Chlorobiaceae bacterium]